MAIQSQHQTYTYNTETLINGILNNVSWNLEYQWPTPAKKKNKITITEVIFRIPMTLVRWSDGTETMVTCRHEDWDEEKGLAMAIVKKFLGNYTDFNTALENAFRDTRVSRKQKKLLSSGE